MEIKIVRKIDRAGRIVIPKDIRATLNLKTEDCVEITVNRSAVVLKKRIAESLLTKESFERKVE